jgi:hypothetical protein
MEKKGLLLRVIVEGRARVNVYGYVMAWIMLWHTFRVEVRKV